MGRIVIELEDSIQHILQDMFGMKNIGPVLSEYFTKFVTSYAATNAEAEEGTIEKSDIVSKTIEKVAVIVPGLISKYREKENKDGQ
jgi:hypothetical protein